MALRRSRRRCPHASRISTTKFHFNAVANAQRIAAALGRRRAHRLPDGGYFTCCPVPSHGKGRGDRDPSLRISDGETKLLVHCYAGCDCLLILGELRRRGIAETYLREARFLVRGMLATVRGLGGF